MSLRVRVFGLVMASVLPAVGIQLLNELHHHADARAALKADAQQMAGLVARDLDRTVAAIERTLRSGAPVPAGASAAGCGRALDGWRAAFDDVAAVWMLDAQGRVVCGSGASPSRALARDPWWGEAWRGEHRAARGVAGLLGEASGVPIATPSADAQALLVAVLDPRRLAARYARWPWTPHGSVTVADGDGNILVHLPEGARGDARLAPAWSPLLRAAGPGAVDDGSARDGQERLVGYVPPASTATGLFVGVGLLDEPEGWLGLPPGVANTIMLVVLSVLSAAAIAWLVSEHLVHRPLDVLTQTARQLRSGDLATRAHLAPSDASEFGGLGSTFNELAETLQQREAERAAHDEALRRARDAAEAASRSKTHFLAAVSHDLRQPLHSMSLATDLLRMRLQGTPEVKLADRVGRSVANLADLVSAVLDVSQLDAGLIVPQVDDYPLARVLQGAADDFADEAARKRLELRIDPVRCWVRSDPRLLRRIVHNLVSNAVKYTPEGGTVQVSCTEGATHVELAVADSGIGIAPERQAEIWEEFRQLENPARDPAKGLGLGLSIVRRMATLLGHPLALSSEPGGGTVVTLRMPKAEPRAQADTPASAPRFAGRVLLVEDDVQVAESTASMLAEWGLEVDVMRSAEAAMAAIAEASQPWQALLSDFRLPGRSGLDVINVARRRWPWLHALVITGDVGANLKAAVPADVRVLAKPLSSAALAEALAPLAKEAIALADPEAATPVADSDGVLQPSGKAPSTMARPPS